MGSEKSGWARWLARRGVRPSDGPVALVAVTVVLVFAARARITTGAWEFPLDDAYIYQQFARNLAKGFWFEFQAGAGYTPGSTSMLFPFFLLPGYLAGLSPAAMVVYTWVLDGLLVVVSAALAHRIGGALGGRSGARLATVLLLSTGSFLAGALSGLEIALFTAMLLATVWLVIQDSMTPVVPKAVQSRRLWGVAALLGLARPEGILVTAAVVVAVLAREGRRGRPFAWVVWPATGLPYLMVGLYNLGTVGHFTPNTAQLKSVFDYPRQSWGNIVLEVLNHFGRFWKSLWMTVDVPQLLPLGILTAFLALGWLAVQARAEVRHRDAFPHVFLIAVFFAGVAAGCVAVVPGNYYRYYHPTFALTSAIAGVALARLWGWIQDRATASQQRTVRWGGVIVLAAIGVGQVSSWSGLLAKGCSEIRGQQHAMADWIATHTPPEAGILLNDVGAITYYTQRPIFDYLGLVTNHQARVFLEGSGALLERLERIPEEQRPAYLAVFPAWLRLPWIVGPELFRTEVSKPLVSVQYPVASIYIADWTLLRSGEKTDMVPEGARVVDRVDVADLDSEQAHGYRLEVPAEARGARFTTGVGVMPRSRGSIAIDGGREITLKEHFSIHLSSCRKPGVTARFDADGPTAVEMVVGGVAHRVDLEPGLRDYALDLDDLPGCPGSIRVDVVAVGPRPYRVYHYWFWIR